MQDLDQPAFRLHQQPHNVLAPPAQHLRNRFGIDRALQNRTE